MNKRRPFLFKPLPGETIDQFKVRVKRVLKLGLNK